MPFTPSPPDDLTVGSLTSDQIKKLIHALASFPHRARERGRDYALYGRVGPLLPQPNAIGARVRGTHVYDAWWNWENGAWDPSCNCPVGYDCKHQYALACCILEPLRANAAQIDRRLPRLLPSGRPRAADLGFPDPQQRRPLEEFFDPDDDIPLLPPPPLRADGFTDRSAHPSATALAGAAGGTIPLPDHSPPRSPASLMELSEARDPWSRSTALQRLLGPRQRVPIPMFVQPFADILAETDFDVMCWRLAQVVPDWTGGWLPAALEPYRDRPDLARRHAATMHDALAARISDWSAERLAAPERRLRFVLGCARAQDGAPVLTVQGRLTAKRLEDQPRTLDQLRHLLREAGRRPGLLPAEDLELLDAYLSNPFDWMAGPSSDGTGVTTATLRRMLEVAADTRALVWDPQLEPEIAARWGLEPGGTVRLGGRAASIVPAATPRAETLVLDLRVRWPDGRLVPLAETWLLRGAIEGQRRTLTFVVCEGEIHPIVEQPPAEIMDQLIALGGLPLEPQEHLALFDQMARRFPSMRESLAPVTRLRRVTPVVGIDLREDDWMQIRLFAAPAGADWRPIEPVTAPERVDEFMPRDGWLGVPSRGTARARAKSKFEPTSPAPPAPVAADASSGSAAGANTGDAAPVTPHDSAEAEPALTPMLERMDDEAMAPAMDWLARTGAADGDRGGPGGLAPHAPDRNVGWWLHFGARRMEAFAEAWIHRPPGVRWYCTARAKRMLGDVRQIRPQLKIESSGIDWFTVSSEWEAEGVALTEADLAALRAGGGPYVKLSSGWVRRESNAVDDQAADYLLDLGLEPGAGPQRVNVWQLAQAHPDSLRALESMGADPRTLETIRLLRHKVATFAGVPHAPVPGGFHGELRPYQQEGVDFLAFGSALGLGAVLADDMGLGKTVQALAWLLWLRKRTPSIGPALVVCPASVVHNWAREAETFAPELRVALLTSGEGRHAVLREARDHDLLVTNYALLRRDIEVWKKIPLGVAILDEAQNIKNPDAAVSRAALQLEATHRMALTGTPLENRALDIWSIMAFVNPGLLGPRASFVTRFDRAEAPAESRRLLKARLRPVLLRRLKVEVAKDLPERIEERRDCEMHPGQRRAYLAELARSRALIDDLAARPEDLNRNRIEILAALTRLRQICCHPALAGATNAGGSGKFDALWELLEPLLEEGHKVLVFSQFVRCLDLIRAEMITRDIAHHVLTGQTRKREEVVANFQADERPSVFLISLKAGGTGLNLTAASYVVLFDPWWNPAVEAQAIDRTHRIGQTRNVIAYRLLTRGTLEEKIWELQQRKAAMARDLLGEDGFAKTLTRADLEYLLATE